EFSPTSNRVSHLRALATAPRIKPTSIFLRSARRLNPGRGSTYRRGIFVQTTGTSSGRGRDPGHVEMSAPAAKAQYIGLTIEAPSKSGFASIQQTTITVTPISRPVVK